MKKLSNGMRVIFVPDAKSLSATALLLCGVGSRHESAALSGASHYIEHMMFKGTKRRPKAMDISRDLDAVGASYNAYTGKDLTGYWVHLQAGKLPLAIDMIHDMIYGSLFRQSDLDSERQVINEELRMYEDNPMIVVDEYMEEELYRGSSLARPIGGTVESIAGIDRKALIGYRDQHYVPSRTVLGIAGNYDDEAVMEQLERTFGKVKKAPTPRKPESFSISKGKYRSPRVRVKRKDSEQVQVAFGWPAFAGDDRRMFACRLLSIILGGNMSSRLFTSVREKRGLAYSVSAPVSIYNDVSNISIQAGLSKDRVHEALSVIMKEVRRITDKKVTKEELSRAKEYYKGKTVLGLESSGDLAEVFMKQLLLYGKVATPEQCIDTVMTITREEIQEVAAEIFRKNRASLAVIGSFDDPAPFAKHLDLLS